MKTKFSKVIYHNHERRGVSHFSVGIDFKTVLLAGIVPGVVNYRAGTRMYHGNFFISIFTFEITIIA